MANLRLEHLPGRSLRLWHGESSLLTYVYSPSEDQVESPRPYFHPVNTLGGRTVTCYRPRDHVWHKGISWSMPNVGDQNFWGGVTYLRGIGYRQLDNNGTMRHRGFQVLQVHGHHARIVQHLDWVTQAGQIWFREHREFSVSVAETSWTLGFGTQFTNISAEPVSIGSPTTRGRDNAGYGGLFWRGSPLFTGGRIRLPPALTATDPMGTRAPWLGITSRADRAGAVATVLFVDGLGNSTGTPGLPTRWFVRVRPFPGVCPAPYFDTEQVMEPQDQARFRYAIIIADGSDAHHLSKDMTELFP